VVCGRWLWDANEARRCVLEGAMGRWLWDANGARRCVLERAMGVRRTMRACSPLASCEPSPKRFTAPRDCPPIIFEEEEFGLVKRARG